MAFISVFDILKIGVGPSSSHTMGPWKAAQRFVAALRKAELLDKTEGIKVTLYGSLALTGKGHGTDIAIMIGLNDYEPRYIPINEVQRIPKDITERKKLNIGQYKEIPFDPEVDFDYMMNEQLKYHPNGMKLIAYDRSRVEILKRVYFSVGGGFVQDESEFKAHNAYETEIADEPFPFESAADIKKGHALSGKSIAQMARENELHVFDSDHIDNELNAIWNEMLECMYRGCHTSGELPGGLSVRRRAKELHEKLKDEGPGYTNAREWVNELRHEEKNFKEIVKWVSTLALAVNEENANFSRVVTAPTNGAAGVIPAVLGYYVALSGEDVGEKEIHDFLLVCGVIGALFKKKATISAAMGGCQAEIGVSSAMAAAALTECMGGTVAESLMAAEIAMEHHLGLTCDPVNGLVQVPCIERNTMGAIKAITATQLAHAGDPEHAKVSLDDVIKTMWETAKDMNSKYKETSKGGLATNISVIVPEC